MEDSKKKFILIGVVVGCLVLAGIITFATRSDIGIKDTGEMTWLKCRKCKAEFQMNKADHQKYSLDYMKQHPVAGFVKIACKECGEEEAIEVMKCEKCGHAFRSGAVRTADFPDTCPKCKFSKTEERIKNK